MTTFKKDIVWPFDPTPWVEGVPVGKIFATMLLPASSALIWYATWLLSEKDIVWPFDPTPWVEGVSLGKIFATMLLPASSALIWYATWPYSGKVQFWPWPHSLSLPNRLGPRPSNWNSVWYVSYLLLLCLCAKFQQKILTIALVIAKFKYLTFDPLGGVKGGGVKLWHCNAYLQALGNHGLIVRSC